ncbi:hypothetical protein KOR42_11830 [Thalassoglobus neptunius]|uniref:Uncharacterized protein n=1 Tax=Thalassoglobus neptunius TaxID=1938619 RepID=A0A5C5X4A0_9PLAN|nr:hypothetical protein KOR42_11830 [Thalassoglobus neptunius]
MCNAKKSVHYSCCVEAPTALKGCLKTAFESIRDAENNRGARFSGVAEVSFRGISITTDSLKHVGNRSVRRFPTRANCSPETVSFPDRQFVSGDRCSRFGCPNESLHWVTALIPVAINDYHLCSL